MDVATENEDLFGLLNEIYRAGDIGLFRLGAAGIRTAFEHTATLAGADTNLGFEAKLADMHIRGVLSTRDLETLATLVSGGHAAVHRAWAPDRYSFGRMLKHLHHFIERVLFHPKETEALKAAIPPRGVRERARR